MPLSRAKYQSVQPVPTGSDYQRKIGSSCAKLGIMDVIAVAKLANLSVTPEEQKLLGLQFSETLKTVNLINELDTSEILPTSQVTGLTNIFREDIIDTARILPPPQENQGFFVVPAIFK